MNYRKLYSDHYKIAIPEGFDIHHIDEDRENNDISNLVLLPSRLHHQYHFYKSIAMKWNPGGDLYSQDISSYNLKSVEAYCKACNECKVWMHLKSYMDGENMFPYPIQYECSPILNQLTEIGLYHV